MNDTKNESQAEQTTQDEATEPETAAPPAGAADEAAAEAAVTETDAAEADNGTGTTEASAEDADSTDAADEATESEADATAPPSLEDQVGELKDRLLRTMAELENTRRRAERDREQAGKFAITGFARSVLTVADNLRRAIASVSDEERESEAVKPLLAGVEMIERELLKAFEQHGVKAIEPLGEKFDHNFHQAMFEVEASGQPPGTIVQVMEVGYVIADRLLRPAMVGIAKAEPAGDQACEDAPRIDTEV